MLKNIRHTGIVVKDLEDSLKFYQDLLGFQTVKRMEESGEYLEKVLGIKDVAVTTVKMSLPDKKQKIELIEYHTPPPGARSMAINDAGPTHISLTVNNIESEYTRLSEAGIEFLSRPQTSPDGYAKVAFCRAPEGTFIEIVEEMSQS